VPGVTDTAPGLGPASSAPLVGPPLLTAPAKWLDVDCRQMGGQVYLVIVARNEAVHAPFLADLATAENLVEQLRSKISEARQLAGELVVVEGSGLVLPS